MTKNIGAYVYSEASTPSRGLLVEQNIHSSVNIGAYVYSEASTPSRGLLVEQNIHPLIVLTNFPQANVNSAQAYFEFRVESTGGTVLTSALAYYRTSPTDAYTPLGISRVVPAYQVSEGLNYIDFKAEINTVWSTVLSYQWHVDLTPPLVQEVIPLSGATEIDALAPIKVIFNEDVQASPIINDNAIEIQPSVLGTWSGSGTTYIFTPDTRLEYETDYALVATNGVVDLAGNQIVAGEISHFTTAAKANVVPEPPNFTGLTIISRTSSVNPQIVFNVPIDVDNDLLHFTVEIKNVGSGQVRLFTSLLYPDSFIYYPESGSRTKPFPVSGVSPGSGKVVFITPIALLSGDYDFKIFADDRR